jgi:hypothetical protein
MGRITCAQPVLSARGCGRGQPSRLLVRVDRDHVQPRHTCVSRTRRFVHEQLIEMLLYEALGPSQIDSAEPLHHPERSVHHLLARGFGTPCKVVPHSIGRTLTSGRMPRSQSTGNNWRGPGGDCTGTPKMGQPGLNKTRNRARRRASDLQEPNTLLVPGCPGAHRHLRLDERTPLGGARTADELKLEGSATRDRWWRRSVAAAGSALSARCATRLLPVRGRARRGRAQGAGDHR